MAAQRAFWADARSSRRWAPPVFYKLSLANKIFVSTLILLTVLGLMGSAVFQLLLRAQLRGEVAAHSRVLASQAAVQAGPLLAGGDVEKLARLVNDLVQLDDTIAYAIVFDRGGSAVVHTFRWDPPPAVAPPSAPAPLGEGEHRRVVLNGETYLEVTAPILSGAAGLGVLRLGVGSNRVDRFVSRLNLIFLAIIAGLAVMGMGGARLFTNYVTRPVVELTHLADKVSEGDLDVHFDWGKPVRCWQIKQCSRTDCAAYDDTTVQCWFVDGTPCEGYESRFPQKLVGCRTCEVYQAHKGDEIVQLHDSFRHMTHELRRSQQEIERSDRFQASLIRNSFDGIIATDEAGTVRIFNRVAQNLSGYTEEEVVGRMTWDELFTPEPSLRQPLFHDGSKVIFGFYRQERTLARKDGATVAVRASGITLLEDEREVGRVFFFHDLRELKQLREELIRSERLAATGQTVASISHAVKNILEGLRGGAYIYRRGVRIEDPAVRGEGWSMVERNIDIISALVADLLSYARDREPDLSPVDPNELAVDVLRTLQPKADAQGVALQHEPDPATSPWALDVHAMHQCLVNLVTNAIDATAAVDGGWVRVSTMIADDGRLEIRVQDNGPGIAPNLLDDLFSSMVTTKGSKGTGLGLLVVNKVVKEHGGTVAVDPDMAPGATFRIFIPHAAAAGDTAPGDAS